jgi:hypothetical protein
MKQMQHSPETTWSAPGPDVVRDPQAIGSVLTGLFNVERHSMQLSDGIPEEPETPQSEVQ